MTGPVAWTHAVIETDLDPLTIPPRPKPRGAASWPGVECRPMADRLLTYELWHADHGRIGFIRWLEDGSFRARTIGSADEAADVRTFQEQHQAVAWLEKQFNPQGRS